MACRPFEAKPLPKPMQTYHQLVPWEQNSMTVESKYQKFICESVFENFGVGEMVVGGGGGGLIH